ncbi:Gfo/Idh/MocA family protein [Porticoccus sp. GXU_MW_L64]
MATNPIKTPVRWGIAGLGKIARRFAADLTTHVSNGVLQGVASRNGEKARSFSEEFACPLAFGSYEELAVCDHIDAVYVATIHPFHRPLVELFLQNRKHVLVEKPAFTSLADWDAMAELARRQQCLLVEAMKVMTFPAYRELVSFLRMVPKVAATEPVAVENITAAFGNYHQFDPALSVFDKSLSGGASWDVGVYPLWLYADICRHLGIAPGEPQAQLSEHTPGSGVDERCCYRFGHKGGMGANLSASLVDDFDRDAVITGPQLDILMHGKWWNPHRIDIAFQGRDFSIEKPVVGGGMQYEAMHFGELLLQGRLSSPWLPADQTRRVLGWVEGALCKGGFQHLVSG